MDIAEKAQGFLLEFELGITQLFKNDYKVQGITIYKL